MFIVSLSKSINRNLIRYFDQSRISYMIFVFPAYQFIAFMGITTIIFSFEEAGTSPYFALFGMILAFFIGVPIFASWHLSCVLFLIGYFGFLAQLGFPFMPWVKKQLEYALNWFRPIR